MFGISKRIRSTLIATTLALSAFSLNVQAALSSYTSNGVDLVYSSVSNVSWTKDGNLLGTMIANSGDSDSNGTKDVIDAILQVAYSKVPAYYVPIFSTVLNASSFDSNGQSTWFASMAFVDYLNSVNYGGSDQWRLPTVATLGLGTGRTGNGIASGDEMVELYADELGVQKSKGLAPFPDNTYFDNEQASIYWSGTTYYLSPFTAYGFDRGNQGVYNKNDLHYSWVVTDEQMNVSTVPEPASVAMLLLGLGVALGILRRRQKFA